MDKENERVRVLADKLKALAHPARLCMVKILYLHGECNISYFVDCMPMSQSSISQHLGKLRDQGVVKMKRQGQEIHYSLVDEDVKKIIVALFAKEESK
ncbi:ArsR/SmtB family transcription factor [Sharpea azabuensis]|uniref:ArsR/SmtB family transcription factor n=1 Tax=Sharpea azabuensis TaxID=322505 RepID=UPI00156975AD|nr:metalloregulator ArsR/SmtB family transcription factor [Sharpea azabuensis]